jgi:hypothetical protein
VLGRFGVTDRVEVVGGDIFQSVPAGYDLYLMKTVLHDWNDEEARAILQVCRRAVRLDSEVWLVEAVLPDGAQPHPARFPDLHIMVTVGGRERTEANWRGLLESTGFALARIIPLPGPQSIVVARPM